MSEAREMAERLEQDIHGYYDSLAPWLDDIMKIVDAAYLQGRRSMREEAARVAEGQEKELSAAAGEHPPDSPSRDRCSAMSRTANDIATSIRAIGEG